MLENYLNTWILSYIVFDMKNQMYEHLDYMSMNFFASVKPGEIITRITSDICGIQNVFRGTLVSIVQNLLIVLTTAAALFYMQWKPALLTSLSKPVYNAYKYHSRPYCLKTAVMGSWACWTDEESWWRGANQPGRQKPLSPRSRVWEKAADLRGA